VLEIRGRGLMLGIELRDWQGVSAGERAWQVVTGCLARGVVVLPCGSAGEVIQLTPPAVLTPEQRNCVVRALADSLAQTTGGTADA
jgi:4-aminobutyrate aminotransferase-like enzyme